MSETIEPSAMASVTFSPDARTRGLNATAFLSSAAIAGLADVAMASMIMRAPLEWRPVFICFALLLLIATYFVSKLAIGAARGLPRLTVTATGVKVTTSFGERWAEWSSLTPFVLGTVRRTSGPPVLVAKARIKGDDVSRNLRNKPEFVIGAVFGTPVPALVDELNSLKPHDGTGEIVAAATPSPDLPARGKRRLGTLAMAAMIALIAVSTLANAYRIILAMK